MNLLTETIMPITKHRNTLFRAIQLAAGLLTLAAPSALADSVYPPGWNVRTENVGPILFDFKDGGAGCWSDYRRYWPGQTRCTESVPSHPMSYGPVVNEFTAGGKRYHRVQEASPPDITAEGR